MSLPEYDRLLRFLADNSTAFSTPNHLLCTLCRKLINNCRKCPCNCKYCFKCITKYLESSSKCCCGPTVNCKRTMLVLSRDIKADNKTDMEICNLKMPCPYQPCGVFDKIWEVCCHSDICLSRPSLNNVGSTPSFWGCEIAQGYESFYDTTMTDNIKEMKSDIAKLQKEKAVVEKLVNDNQRLFEEIKELTNVITKMDTELNDLKSSKRKHNIEMDRLNKSNAELKKHSNKSVNDPKENEIKMAALVRDEVSRLIDPLKQNIKSMTKEISEIKENNVRLVKEVSKMTKEESECVFLVKFLSKRVGEIDAQIEEICFNVGILAYKSDLRDSDHADLSESVSDGTIAMYTWSVSNFSAYKAEATLGKNRKLTSKDFHASDSSYKIHFDLYPSGYGDGEANHLSVFAVIKKRNECEWTGALSYDITASISVNGQRQNTHKLDKLKKTLKVAMKDVDHSVGIERFVEIERVFGEPCLLVNNTLTLEFLVKRK